MFPSLRTVAATAFLILASGACAEAQYYYPAGYAGYGWNGWGAGGGTVPGDIARGMGVFAAGAGYYNEQTAKATAINAETAMKWNEYWYRSQQAANRRYYARLAERKDQNVKSHEEIHARLRDNPTKYDIYRGDALNVALDELTSPQVYIRELKGASEKFPGEMIRDDPVQLRLGRRDRVRPPGHDQGPDPPGPDTTAVRGRPGQDSRDRRHDPSGGRGGGEIDPETLDRMEAAIKALQAKVSAKLAANTKDRTEAERFLKAAAGLTRMLRTPAINVLLADVDKHPETTVGDLLGFMKAFNLRFGVADDLRERKVYDRLYPILAKLRDQARPDRKPGPTAEAEANVAHPIDFFSAMEDKAISPTTVPPAPTPAPPK